MYGSMIVRARQGTCPVFGDVRVEVMRIAVSGGRKITQLSIRSPRRTETVLLSEGDSADLHGVGWLTIQTIEEVHDAGVWVVMEFMSIATGPAA